jgi:serine/threonine protein kinase
MSKESLLTCGLVDLVRQERDVLERVQSCANVCYFYGSFQDDYSIYFMLEYIPGGELRYHLNVCGSFDLWQTRFYAAEVVVVLSMLHSMHIVYCDLKPENLMLDCEGHIKFIDFGLAKEVLEPSPSETDFGSAVYAAPEVWAGAGYRPESDWWAFGVLVYEMITGKWPWGAGKDIADEEVPSVIRQKPGFDDPRFDACTIEFLSGLLQIEWTDRLGAGVHGDAEIKNHPWFAGYDWDTIEEWGYETPQRIDITDWSDTNHFPQYDEPGDLAVTDIPVTTPVPEGTFDGF